MLIAGRLTKREFTLRDPSDSQPEDASSLPSAVLVRDGVETGVSVTIAKMAASTGRYTASFTVPDDAEQGESFQVRATATVGGVTDSDYVIDDVVGYTPEEIAAAVRTAFASVSFTVAGSLTAEGVLSIVKGDDYYEADGGRGLTFEITGSSPDYTGASVLLRMKSGGVYSEVAGTVETATGSTRVVSFELPSADTSLPVGNGEYEIQVTLTNTHVLTPLRGVLQVLRKITE